MALKCADLGHLASPRDVHKKWVERLEEEFFRQGDREKQNGLSVSPLMDREKNGITKSQVGFFGAWGARPQPWHGGRRLQACSGRGAQRVTQQQGAVAGEGALGSSTAVYRTVPQLRSTAPEVYPLLAQAQALPPFRGHHRALNTLYCTGLCTADIVALPLFQSFAQAFPDATPMLDAVKDNYAMWREEAQAFASSQQQRNSK